MLDHISTAGSEGPLAQPCPLHHDMKPLMDSSGITQGDEAQRVSVIGLQRRERLVRLGDLGIFVQ